jgi:hypothetical protein
MPSHTNGGEQIRKRFNQMGYDEAVSSAEYVSFIFSDEEVYIIGDAGGYKICVGFIPQGKEIVCGFKNQHRIAIE